MSLVFAPPSPDAADQVDHVVTLHDVPWAQYVALDTARGESAVPRLTFRKGTLTIMSPSTHHERIKTVIARLLEAWADLRDVDLEGFGSWTIRDEVEELGLEPDECYILGDAAGRDAPDIALEVVWTHGILGKLAIYAALGVREVWVWERGGLHVYALRGNVYEPVPRSELVPGIDLELIASLVGLRQSEAVRTLRERLAP